MQARPGRRASSLQRTARSGPGFIGRRLRLRAAPALDPWCPGRQPQDTARSSSCRSPDSPASPSVPAPPTRGHAPNDRHVAPRGRYHQIAHLQQGSGALISTPEARVEDLFERVAAHRERERDEHDAETGREVPPPRTERDGGVVERVLEHHTPRDAQRVAETEERERALGEDRDGTVNVRLAKISGITLGRMCREMRCQCPAPSARRAVDVAAFDREHLRGGSAVRCPATT